MTVVGETYVRVLPETSGFAPALEADVTGASRTAGAVAGREASAGFQSGFKAPAGLSQVESELGKVDRGATAAAFSFTGFGRAVAYASGTFLVAGSAIATLKASIETAGQIQGEQALVAKSIENAGASNKLYGESIDSLIQKQALQTGFTETQLLPAFGRLVQATGSTQKAYQDLGLAEDLARQRGTNVSVAALAVGKAADGSVTSLQRYGIVLSTSVTKGLSAAEKGNLALEAAQEKVGGSAALYAETGAGALARLGVAAEVLKEQVGEALLPEVVNLADGLATWLENSQHLAEVQHDVAAGAQAVGDAVHVVADGFHVVDTAVTPVVTLLGGYGRTAELVFGAVAVAKVQKLLSATVTWVATNVSGLEASAAAETTYTAAVTANTAALDANAASSTLALRGVSTLGAGTVAADTEMGAATATAGVASSRFLSMGASVAGVGSVFTSSLLPAVALGGYELSTFIEKIPGWESAFKGLGGAVEDLASKFGLVSKGASAASLAAAGSLSNPQTQAQLREAYKKAVQEVPLSKTGSLPDELRDKIVASIVGPGFSFHDAQVIARGERMRQTRVASEHYVASTAQISAAQARRLRPTDADYQLQLDAALQTPGTRDELALYRSRASYLGKRIDRLKGDGNLDAAQQKQLESLYQQRDQVEQSISSITTAAANARKQRIQKEQAAYTTAVSDHEQLLKLAQSRAALTAGTGDDTKANQALLAFYKKETDDTRLTVAQRQTYESDAIQIETQTLQTEQTAYQTQLSLREQRLQLQVQRAQLTTNNLDDDRKAERALILFYQQEAHDMKLTAAQRLQYQSQAVAAQLQLQQLTGTASGATVAQIFGAAVSQFATYGSNIGARGQLSGEDARARFAELLLTHGSKAVDVAKAADNARAAAHLDELRKQTGLQTDMRDSLRTLAGQIRKSPSKTIADARAAASRVGVG